jgi:hypothetical protein
MADWKKVAKAFALGDGHVSEREVEILRTEFFADEKITKQELEFLYELKRSARSTVKAFDQLVEDCEKAQS